MTDERKREILREFKDSVAFYVVDDLQSRYIEFLEVFADQIEGLEQVYEENQDAFFAALKDVEHKLQSVI